MNNMKSIIAVLVSGGLLSACAVPGGYVSYPVSSGQVTTSYSADAYFPQPAVVSYSSTNYIPSPIIIRNTPAAYYSFSNTSYPYRAPYRRPMNFPVTNDNDRFINRPAYMPKPLGPAYNPNMKPGQPQRPGQPPSLGGPNNNNRPPFQPGSNGNNGKGPQPGNGGPNRPFVQPGNNGNAGNPGNSGSVNNGNNGNNGNKGNNGVHNGITQGNGSNGVGNAGGQTRLPPGQAKK